MEIKDIQKEVHQTAKDHGWWDKPKTFGEIIALIHSEASEALEEYRNHLNHPLTYYSGEGKYYDGLATSKIIVTSPYQDIKFQNGAGEIITSKPEGIPSELADIVIRVMDYCEWAGINLEAAILEKHEYNKSRPYKHGGKAI